MIDIDFCINAGKELYERINEHLKRYGHISCAEMDIIIRDVLFNQKRDIHKYDIESRSTGYVGYSWEEAFGSDENAKEPILLEGVK